jgi:hypothetical protein
VWKGKHVKVLRDLIYVLVSGKAAQKEKYLRFMRYKVYFYIR